jgi:hypothetical protein
LCYGICNNKSLKTGHPTKLRLFNRVATFLNEHCCVRGTIVKIYLVVVLYRVPHFQFVTEHWTILQLSYKTSTCFAYVIINNLCYVIFTLFAISVIDPYVGRYSARYNIDRCSLREMCLHNVTHTEAMCIEPNTETQVVWRRQDTCQVAYWSREFVTHEVKCLGKAINPSFTVVNFILGDVIFGAQTVVVFSKEKLWDFTKNTQLQHE